jgi:hypothetical protein
MWEADMAGRMISVLGFVFFPWVSVATPSVGDFVGTYEFFRFDGSSCQERPLGSKIISCKNPKFLKYTEPHVLSLSLSKRRERLVLSYANANLGSFMQLQYPVSDMTAVAQEVGIPYQGFEFDIDAETVVGDLVESEDGLFAQRVSSTPFLQFRLVRFVQPNDGEVDYGVEFLRSEKTRVQVYALTRNEVGQITDSWLISDNEYHNPMAVELAVQYLQP